MRTDPSKRHMPMMTDADMAMKVDPIYNAICQKFRPTGLFRRHLRPRLVQADPPRHGPEGELSRPDVPGRRPDLAGSDPRRLHLYDVDAVKAKIAASGLTAPR
jgi:catalase-peroxidase